MSVAHLFAEILDLDLALGVLACFAATAVQGYTGFGGGLIAVPLMTILFGPVEGIAVAALGSIVGMAQLLPDAVRNAVRHEAAPLMAAVLIATPLGTAFLVSADPTLVRIGIGTFVLGSAAMLVTNLKYRGPRGTVPSFGVGLAAGGLTGAFGIPGGPIVALYFLASPSAPAVQRANMQLVSVLTVGMLLLGLAAGGQVGATTVARSLFVAPATVIGVASGAFLFRVAPAKWFRYVALAILVVSGISVIVA